LTRLRELFSAIESGSVTVAPERDPADVFAGNVTYRTSNGWTVVVFNDCQSFDYIDHVISPEGEKVGTFDLPWDDRDEARVFLAVYDPPGEQVHDIWRFPR
jgi:hypothetical protein